MRNNLTTFTFWAFSALVLTAYAVDTFGQDSTLVTVSWSANTEPDIDHYELYAGKMSRSYELAGVTHQTQLEIAVSGTTYFAVGAVDAAGNVSAPSEEVRWPAFEPVIAGIDTVEEGQWIYYEIGNLGTDTQGMAYESDSIAVKWLTDQWHFLNPDNGDYYIRSDTLAINLPLITRFIWDQDDFQYNYKPRFRLDVYHDGHEVLGLESPQVYIKPPETGIPAPVELRRIFVGGEK
jgi:hypothetical protein